MWKLIVIGGPDKLSINSFINFIKRVVGVSYNIGNMHSLMTNESKELYVKDFKSKYPNGIIGYYAKRMINKDPKDCLPEIVKAEADLIIWFNLYSTDPIIVKDPGDSSLKTIIDNWNQYIKKLGG